MTEKCADAKGLHPGLFTTCYAIVCKILYSISN